MLVESMHEPATLPVATSQLGLIQRLYDCRKGKVVLQFLAAHAFLLPLLEEVQQKAAVFFTFSSKPVLEVTIDPEAFESQTLFVFIQTNAALEEALRQLDRFDEEWWLAASASANGKLCVDVECV